MASVTHSNAEVALHSGPPSIVRIEPLRDCVELRLNEFGNNCELL